MKWLLILLLPAAVIAQETLTPLFQFDPVNLVRELLGTNDSFTATAEISGFSTNAADDFVLNAEYAMLHGQLRTVVDLAKIRGLNACDVAQGRLQESGTDLAISIRLPKLRRAYTVYPRIQSYVETVLTWREDLKEIDEITKTKVRDETFDGHPVTQYRVHVVSKMGNASDVRVWLATDLDNFPIQIRYETTATTFNIHFQNVNRTPPDPDLFQPPADYDRYPSIRELSRTVRGR